MGNLIKHAKFELELADMFNEKGDFYGGMTAGAVMELIKVFEKQGHSGGSAPGVIALFSKLANYEIIFNRMKSEIEKQFGVKITEAPFTYLSNVKENELILSCQKDYNNMIMAVLTPN